jgi:hypothetical protein
MHSETKYGFTVLTGDMTFKHFFVDMKLCSGINTLRVPLPTTAKIN